MGNSRFKFRIWHKPLKQMHYNDFIVTATGYMAKIYQQDDYMMKFNQEDLEFDKQCILMQCTGLKDKNGKLIYEGDVVKIFFKSLNQKITDVVEWDNTTARFKFAKFGQISIYNYTETWEVIGNIYQDSHLIENSNNLC